VQSIPLDAALWNWGSATATTVEHLGRACTRLQLADDSSPLVTAAGVELLDGTIEADVAVGPERSFHGVFWRGQGEENYESFFVRPHQVGNPDSIQYTPVFNDISCWQLYHGPGYWNAIDFPLDTWFTIRVVFAGRRAEVFVAGDLALVVPELKAEPKRGAIGVFAGGDTFHVSGFRYDVAADLTAPAPAEPERPTGVVPRWSVSDAFTEAEIPAGLDPAALSDRTWTRVEAEPLGLADLARVNGIKGEKNTVFARASLHSPRAQLLPLDLGFSDRAVVFLNGRRLYRGDDSYRSRDYRFLGSIGYYDTVYLPLAEGENELVVAVSESFGGWGIQAREAFGEAPEGASPNIRYG
jgi:hypothetical protein